MAERGPQRKHGMRLGKPYGRPGKRVLTATFAECGENEPGMEHLGEMGPPEIAVELSELKALHALCKEKGLTCYLHKFHRAINRGPLGPVAEALPEADAPPEAGVLVVRGLFKSSLVDAAEEAMWDDAVPIDTMALMGRGTRRKVFNKNARHNNCMTEAATRPPNIASKEDYENGKGSVLALEDFPHMNKMRRRVERMLGRKLGVVENNYYYRVGRECGIGWHGDKERRVAVLLRLGEAAKEMPLCYQFFWNYKAWGPIFELPLRHGDVVFMSRVAVGTDWDDAPRRRWTMRHATGVAHTKPKDPEHATVLRMHPA